MKNENRIKELRVERGLSVKELAAMIGKDRATMYRYENGDIENLPAKALQDIAEALHTTAAYLMGWDDDPYDYVEDPENILSGVPSAVVEELRRQGKSAKDIYYTWESIHPEAEEVTDSRVKAAFFNGADPDLTPEEMDEMWAEAKAYINFKIQQRRSKLN